MRMRAYTHYITTICLLLFISANAQSTHSSFSFSVKVFGKGKPMLFIPGQTGDGEETYSTTVKHYEANYKCYVITLAGFAGQPASKRDSDLLKGQRDELIEYMKEQHLKKPILIGFSFGGVLALWMECTAPDLFGKLVDIDGVPFEAAVENPRINKDSLLDSVKANLEYWRTRTPAQIAHGDSAYHSPQDMKEGFEYLKKLVTDTAKISLILKWDVASDYKATWVMVNEINALDLRDNVANIQSPILVLGSWVGWDIIKTKEQAEKAYAKQFVKAKHCRIVFSDHGKHFLMWDDYDWYINQIDKFLAEKN